MQDESNLELSIDPLTGTTNLAEGTEVYVKGDSGRPHRGMVLAVELGAPARYTVLLTCRGQEREVTVTESDLLARATPERVI